MKKIAAGKESGEHRPSADRRLLLAVHRPVDLLDVLQRIVQEELDFGDRLELVPNPLTQCPAQEPVVLLQRGHDSGILFEGEDADVDLGV